MQDSSKVPKVRKRVPLSLLFPFTALCLQQAYLKPDHLKQGYPMLLRNRALRGALPPRPPNN